MRNITPYSIIFICISYKPGLALIRFFLVYYRVYSRARFINSLKVIYFTYYISFYKLLEPNLNNSTLIVNIIEAIVKIIILKDYTSQVD